MLAIELCDAMKRFHKVLVEQVTWMKANLEYGSIYMHLPSSRIPLYDRMKCEQGSEEERVDLLKHEEMDLENKTCERSSSMCIPPCLATLHL